MNVFIWVIVEAAAGIALGVAVALAVALTIALAVALAVALVVSVALAVAFLVAVALVVSVAYPTAQVRRDRKSRCSCPHCNIFRRNCRRRRQPASDRCC